MQYTLSPQALSPYALTRFLATRALTRSLDSRVQAHKAQLPCCSARLPRHCDCSAAPEDGVACDCDCG